MLHDPRKTVSFIVTVQKQPSDSIYNNCLFIMIGVDIDYKYCNLEQSYGLYVHLRLGWQSVL